jgi:hypothetical protein
MARLNSLLLSGIASSETTESAPAPCPASVIRSGSPPNEAMSRRTQRNAKSWSVTQVGRRQPRKVQPAEDSQPVRHCRRDEITVAGQAFITRALVEGLRQSESGSVGADHRRRGRCRCREPAMNHG